MEKEDWKDRGWQLRYVRSIGDGRHLAFECPVDEEVRKVNINGARTWEDLDNQKGGMEYGSFLWEGDLRSHRRAGVSTGPRSGVEFTNLLYFG